MCVDGGAPLPRFPCGLNAVRIGRSPGSGDIQAGLLAPLFVLLAVVGSERPERKAVVEIVAITAHFEGDLITGDSGAAPIP